MPECGTSEVSILHKEEEWDVEWKILDLDFLIKKHDIHFFKPTTFGDHQVWMFKMPWQKLFDLNTSEKNDSIIVGLNRGMNPTMYLKVSFTFKTLTRRKVLKNFGKKLLKDGECFSFHLALAELQYRKRKSQLLVSGFLVAICKLKMSNAITITEKKEESHSPDLTDSTDIWISPDGKINNILKSNNDLSRERVMKYLKSFEESHKKNSQLNDQLLAVPQKLETEKNKKELLKSQILIKEKEIHEIQSTAQENILLKSLIETKENENCLLKNQFLAVSQELETEKNEREQLKSEISVMEKKIHELQATIQEIIRLNSVLEEEEDGGSEEGVWSSTSSVSSSSDDEEAESRPPESAGFQCLIQ